MKPKTTLQKLLVPAIASALTLAAPAALAGSARVSNAEGQPMLFEYNDDGFLRVTPQDSEDSYMVFRENTLYIVTVNNGQPMVMNASSMMKGMSGLVTNAAPAAATEEVVSLEKTGRTETVAGIKGEVYELVTREEGAERTTEIVMSDDPRAMEFRDAMFLMARSAASSLGGDIEQRNSDLEGRLGELNKGVLRVGQDMVVESIDGDTVADARFALPAQPMDMQGLGELFGAMGQQSQQPQESTAPADDEAGKSGGLFSGMMKAFGGKAERQTERAEKKVDNKVDEETDNALDKAFGKLFGD